MAGLFLCKFLVLRKLLVLGKLLAGLVGFLFLPGLVSRQLAGLLLLLLLKPVPLLLLKPRLLVLLEARLLLLLEPRLLVLLFLLQPCLLLLLLLLLLAGLLFLLQFRLLFLLQAGLLFLKQFRLFLLQTGLIDRRRRGRCQEAEPADGATRGEDEDCQGKQSGFSRTGFRRDPVRIWNVQWLQAIRRGEAVGLQRRTEGW